MSLVKSRDPQICAVEACGKIIQPRTEHHYWQMRSYCNDKCLKKGKEIINAERGMPGQVDHAGDNHGS
jgi:hypothetical protein